MKKNTKKFLSFLMTVTMCCTLISNVAFASDAPGEIKKAVLKIVNAIAYFGYVIAFGMLFFLGAKYTLAPANEKADVKQGSINYFIGAILIFCASGIANLISGIAAGSGGSTTASEIISAAQAVAN